MSVTINEVIYNDSPNGVLHLEDKELTSIPKEIGNLVNLINLYLNDNKLTSIPKEIGNLVKLTYINLKYNKLTSLPREIGNLTNLATLFLGENELTLIPKEIGNLINLFTLGLNMNELTLIPKEIGNLVKLNYLNLNWNKLTDIPKEIGNLQNLTDLDVGNNKLTSLPQEINNIMTLKHIYCINNNIVILPQLRQDIKIESDDNSDDPKFKGYRAVKELFELGIHVPGYANKDNFNFEDFYTILIGSGGSGAYSTVYIVQDKMTMKKYVAKVTDISQIFEIYFYVITRCKHSNLICLHEYFMIESKLYLIYNYIPNSYDLRISYPKLNRSQWYIDFFIRILLDVTSALQYIHNKGILHLDIKPDNILVAFPPDLFPFKHVDP